MADLVAVVDAARASSSSGMMTEAMHTPLLMDRYVALKSADYVYRAARGIERGVHVRARTG